ncbi:MAG: hypothetical protein HPZ91_11065 [Lentisphaeria bacterium]|nr:hypothetical protein [Lentisphaeria bacterium]
MDLPGKERETASSAASSGNSGKIGTARLSTVFASIAVFGGLLNFLFALGFGITAIVFGIMALRAAVPPAGKERRDAIWGIFGGVFAILLPFIIAVIYAYGIE